MNTSEIVAATYIVASAYEYDADFYPDDDGWAGYSNDAKGELFEVTKLWPFEMRQEFAEAFKGRPEYKTAAEVLLWEMAE